MPEESKPNSQLKAMPTIAKKTPAPNVPQVSHTHEDYDKRLPQWQRIADALEGQDRVREKGAVYLPMPNASDTSPENLARYTAYKTRALFYELAARTLDGLVGQVFEKDGVATIPDALAVLENDCDGAGNTLEQVSRKLVRLLLSKGRAGVFADFPTVRDADGSPRRASVAEVEEGGIRPRVMVYQPEDVINWRVVTVGANVLLSLVVIRESFATSDDGFKEEKKDRYRCLRLGSPGGDYDPEGTARVYYVEVWEPLDDNSALELKAILIPTKGNGSPWGNIPFVFAGPENNDPTPDKPPLLPLVNLNFGHYRNSADYEESVYMVGQPTPWVSGLTPNWIETQMKGTLALGSRAVIPLPVGGQAGLLQVAPNTMPKEAMEQKERQAVALGAKLVEQKQVQRTATEAGQEEAAETSVLGLSARNASAALFLGLGWAAEFAGVDVTDETLAFELNNDFRISIMSAQERQQLLAEWQAEAISLEEYRFNMRRAGIAYLDDEEFKDQIETADPIGNIGLPPVAPIVDPNADPGEPNPDPNA